MSSKKILVTGAAGFIGSNLARTLVERGHDVTGIDNFMKYGDGPRPQLEGFEVIEALNGLDGVTAAETEKPDLILMDIQLPLLDGYDATRRIKANPLLESIPVIAVTSYALSGDEEKARLAGCGAYVTRPYSPRQLLATVRTFLS